ncbi:MAG TPA: ATPase with chaperone activity [Burkholderiaceae bacterium]|jgi:hypothetical protein|nr:ATPase with chaperone activity [Burkholderiaceae bacterium]
MSDDASQIEVPPSFVALFVPPGRHKPSEPREHIAARYEFCEDLAQLLTEHARTMLFSLGITEWDVLVRVRRGLEGGAAGVSTDEAGWVTRRLAEVLGWEWSGDSA